MLQMRPLQPAAKPPFTFRAGRRNACAQHTPMQNRLLATLPREDYERLLPELAPFPLLPGTTLYGAGDLEAYLYFLCAGLVSRFQLMQGAVATEFALTGPEGVLGVATYLGGGAYRARAQW